MAKLEAKFDIDQEVGHTEEGKLVKGVTKGIRYDTTRKSFEYRIGDHKSHQVWIDQKYLKPWKKSRPKGANTQAMSKPTKTGVNTGKGGGVTIKWSSGETQWFTSGTQAGLHIASKYKDMPYPKGNADAYAYLDKVIAKKGGFSYTRHK